MRLSFVLLQWSHTILVADTLLESYENYNPSQEVVSYEKNLLENMLWKIVILHLN